MADSISVEAPRRGPALSAADHCRQIAQLLHTNPSMWTQGVYARTRHGDVCNPEGDEAARLCMMGFIMRYTSDAFTQCKIQDVIHRLIGGFSIPAWNDNPFRTVSEVEDVFWRAALLCEQTYMGERTSEPSPQLLDALVPFPQIMEQIEHPLAA